MIAKGILCPLAEPVYCARRVAEVMDQLQPRPRIWTLLIASCVVTGVVLRFGKIDKKIYWFNEVFTTLAISGYDEHTEVNPQLYTGHVVTPADIQVFLRKNSGKNLLDTVRWLARKDPHQGPLYFVVAWFAARSTAPLPLAGRRVAALSSLLALVALYRVCAELFNSEEVAWMAVALAAVSPFSIRYAQEARSYSMWIAMALMASADMLRGIRQPSRRNWAMYSLTIVLALYTHMLTIWVMVAHGIYVLARERRQPDRITARFVLASLAALVFFSPWAANALRRRGLVRAIGVYMSRSRPPVFMVRSMLANLSRVFITAPSTLNDGTVYLGVPVSLMTLYALYDLCGHTARHIWLFILLLIGIPSLAVILPDLLLGGHRSIKDRYFFPAYLAIEVAVAYTLARHVNQDDPGRARTWRMAAIVILGAGAVSSFSSIRAATWWGLSAVDLDLLDIFNDSPHTLIITDTPFGVIAPLSYRLHDGVRLLFTPNPHTFAIPSGYDHVYVYQPSEDLRRAVAERPGRELHLVYQKPREDLTMYSLYKLDQG